MVHYLKDRFRVRLLDEETIRDCPSLEVFDELIRFLRIFLSFCGLDVLLMENFHWTIRTWGCIAAIASFTIALVYTVVHSDEVFSILDTLSISGIALQGAFKLHSGLTRVQYFQEKYLNLRLLHEKFSETPEHNVALNKCVLTILYVFRFFFVAYAGGGLAFFVIPLYMFVIHGELVLVITLEIPFVDPATHYGYIITTAYQVFMIFLAIAGVLAADMAIMILVLHIFAIVDIFINNLKELDQMLDDSRADREEIRRKVTEICMMHREMIKFEEELDSCYHTIVFIQVLTSVSCLSLSLFVLYMTENWSRVTFLSATFFQLLEFCLLGTALTYKNDQAMLAIYDTNWNLLDRSDQRRFIIMLHRSQNAVEMTIGGVALLNMETFVAIMKTIYSYFTMMVTFVD